MTLDNAISAALREELQRIDEAIAEAKADAAAARDWKAAKALSFPIPYLQAQKAKLLAQGDPA